MMKTRSPHQTSCDVSWNATNSDGKTATFKKPYFPLGKSTILSVVTWILSGNRATTEVPDPPGGSRSIALRTRVSGARSVPGAWPRPVFRGHWALPTRPLRHHRYKIPALVLAH